MKRALLVSGGYGTRLRPLTNVIPKALLPVGHETMLERHIGALDRHGFDEVYVSTHYLSPLFQSVLEYISGRYGAKLILLEEPVPTGSFGSAINLCRKLSATGDDSLLLVLNTDVVTDLDLGELYDQLAQSERFMSVVVKHHEYEIPYGVVVIRNGELHAVQEKPKMSYPVMAGVYTVRPSIHNMLPDTATRWGADEVVQALLTRGQSIGVYEHRGAWIDAGTIDDLMKANDLVGVPA